MNDENTIINSNENVGPAQGANQLLLGSPRRGDRGRLGEPSLPRSWGSSSKPGLHSLADETQAQKSALPAGRSRTGKIARLPLAIRQQLNQRLQNGEPARPLIQWLNSLPEVQAVLAAQFEGEPIVQQNLSRWKQGGYENWEQEQRTLQAVAAVFEQATGLKEAVKDGLAERMTLVVTAKMAMEIQRLNSVPDGEKKAKIWRELLGSLVLVRRGNFQGERILVEREKLGFRRERHQREREEEFWQWVEKEEHRDKILEKLLTPEQNDEETGRRNEEQRRRLKEILGIR
jgi:hypothetical protein